MNNACVVKIVLLFMMAASSGSALASNDCTDATEFLPSLCPFEAPSIASIQILENGAALPTSQPPPNCSSFILSETLVRQYFSKAKLVHRDTQIHDLDWSPCHASGTAVLTDGRRMHWWIMDIKVGWFRIVGERGARRLQCEDCNGWPYDQ